MSRNYLPKPKSFATDAIHYGQNPENSEHLPVVAPLVTSSTFKLFAPGVPKKYLYGRCGNPNREILESCLAKLENAQFGLCFASGVGAITAICSMLKSGDHIIYVDDIYCGTNLLFHKVLMRFGLEFTEIDGYNANDIDKIVRPNSKILWTETITNPLLKVIDIRAMAEKAHKYNLLLIVDNTLLSPYFQQPLNLGVDIVIHSVTKYINGHSDVIMGAIVTNNEKIYEELKFLQFAMGTIPAPFDCFQVTRGLKTLAVRMEKHMKNSLIIGKFLEQHPKIEKITHPGLPSHPQHELFKSQTSGCSGMLSFYLKGGLSEATKFLNSLKLFVLAGSLGGYESLVELPSIIMYGLESEERKKILKISDNLIRLSVGLEGC